MGDDKNKRTIALLGAFVFCQNGQRLDLKISGKTTELLAYLIANQGRFVQRSTLVTKLWGARNWGRGKSSLNTALWRIKKISFLKDFFTLDSCETSICLTKNLDVLADIHLLSGGVRQTPQPNRLGPDLLTPEFRSHLQKAVYGYSGPFMENYESDWVLVEREMYLNFYIRALLMLMHDAAGRRDFEEALELGQKILAEDPFRESTQREVMWLYVLNGQRAAAILQYRHFRNLIRRELEIEPLSETQALYRFISAESSCGGPEANLSLKDHSINSTSRFSKFLIATDHSRNDLYSVLRIPVDD